MGSKKEIAMKVTVAVSGRFWSFDLAAQLHRRGYLLRLITSYPKFVAARWGLPRRKVVSILEKELLFRAWRKLPIALRRRFNLDFPLGEYFDWRVSRQIPADTDIFVGLSGFCLRSIRRAKDMGMITVVDHGSSHVEYQRDMLNGEYARFGALQPVTDERPVRKQVKEYAEADYIALSSQFAIRTFVDKGIPRDKILYSPYGVDTSSFKPSPKNDDVFRIVFAGGLSLRKGVHYLLQAFTELALPKSELLLVGHINDEIRPFLERYGGPASGVRAIGSVPQTELQRHYSNSSVFVLDSVEDGFGMVIVQAMACGLPVIASENTGGPDIVRDGKDGFIIPIRDVPILKEKLKYFYDRPEERMEMGRSAAARASSGFTWEDYGERMIAEYDRILQKG
jgi:glycosyltransferase involved in cell wall biosynthesis